MIHFLLSSILFPVNFIFISCFSKLESTISHPFIQLISQGGPVYREIPLFTGENRKPGSRGFPCIQVNGKFSIANLEQ